jgi:hypothetical protein
MHSAVTEVQISVIRTPEHVHSLANFCWGLLIVKAEKGNATEISYSDARPLITFFLGFHTVTTGNERTSKHSAI